MLRRDNFPATLLILFGIAVVARIAATIFFAESDKVFEYQLIAQNLVNGKGMVWDDWGRRPLMPTSMFPPLYIYWCVVFIYLFGQNYLPMFIVQSIVGAAAVFPAYNLGRWMFDARIGFAFAAFIAFYPEIVFLPTRGTPEFLFVIMALFAYSLYVRLKNHDLTDRELLTDSALLGLLIGIGALVREGMILVLGAILFGIARKYGLRWPAWKTSLAPIIVAAGVVMTPWIIRNSIVQGQFVPIRSALGMNLWMGNHADATGSDRTSDGGYQASYLMEKNRDYYATNMPADEAGSDRFMMREALRYIREHPAHYAQLTLKRLGYFVWFTPHHALAANKIYRVSWIGALLFGGAGLMIVKRRRLLDPVVPMTFLLFMLLYVPVIVLPRYRIIPMLLLLLMASYTIVRLCDRWRERRMPAHQP